MCKRSANPSSLMAPGRAAEVAAPLRQAGVSAVSEHPIDRISALAPVFMSILALLAVAHSYRHASHEDGNWHIWILMLVAQLPFFLYFVITNRRQLRRVAPIVTLQAVLWAIGALAGAFQSNWS
jgi:hypothetical protein